MLDAQTIATEKGARSYRLFLPQAAERAAWTEKCV